MPEFQYGFNMNTPPLSVRWQDLEPFDEDEPHKFARKCPACEPGVLLGLRSKGWVDYMPKKPPPIQPQDNCISCGQRVMWLDLDFLLDNWGFREQESVSG